MAKFVLSFDSKASRAKATKQDFCIVSSDSETAETSDGYDSDFPWVPEEFRGCRMAKRRKVSSWLATATSLGGHPKVSELYAFMRKRETARIRREMGLPSSQWYPAGDLMAKLFLTNVRREDDPTTQAVRRVLAPALEHWKGLSCARARHRLAGLLVFHCGLFRAFGTKEFILELGFLNLESWDSASWRPIVETAMACWQRGHPCFTQAYCPSRTWRKRAISAGRCPSARGADAARAIFQEVCEHLSSLWQHRFDVVQAAAGGSSWRQVVQAIMRVSNYGGTGFLAKELAQDLLKTPLFCTWNSATGTWDSHCLDLNDWCPVGPGARRALNRLHGRATRGNCYSSSRTVQEAFVQELRAVYEQRHLFWDPSHLIDDVYPSGELTLHDVQFQLCEFDKYERARLNEGFVRRYVLPVLPKQEPVTLVR